MELTAFSNLPIDLVVIALVLLSGIFQKKYLDSIKIDAAWKTLIVSAVFTVVYALLVRFGGGFTKDMPLKWFFSYVTGTSLYELLLKKWFSKIFPDAIPVIIIAALLLPLASCNAAHPVKATTEMQVVQLTFFSSLFSVGFVIWLIILTVITILFVRKDNLELKKNGSE